MSPDYENNLTDQKYINFSKVTIGFEIFYKDVAQRENKNNYYYDSNSSNGFGNEFRH